ncbi:MAG TPA: glycosyltransferase family 87 protein [Stellaceae bacterium]|nr:glycosyltransferase family 87 protein [Stellaceae bacterium]
MEQSHSYYLRRLDDLLDRPRILAYSRILLALEMALFLFMITGTHGWIVPLDQPNSTDFVSFYAAGSLADAGTPALAYDQAAHYVAEQQATAAGIPYQFFYYPPVYLLLCAALARLPYLVAFIAFEAATLLLYLLVARRILDEQGLAALAPLLAFPAVFWTLGLGQNAFLTASLFGAATLLVDRRPVLAGLLFGALSYKPHFGLLIPVALAAGGQWRAFAAAAAAAAGLCLAALLLFGASTWHAFFAEALASPATYQSGRIAVVAYVTPWGMALQLGAGPAGAWAVQAAATHVAAALVAWVWHCDTPLPVRGAALAAATLIAVPVALMYDLMLAAVAILWLVRAGREAALPPAEKLALLGILAGFAFGMLVLAAGRRDPTGVLAVPVLPLAVLALVAIVAVHAWRGARRGVTPSVRLQT